MGDGGGDSGSDNGEAPQVDWESLESQLSARALESLREHLQAGGAARTELAEEDEAAAPAAPCGSGERGGGGGGGSSGGGREAASKSLPASNVVYKAKDYWNRRFADEESYDWLASYADIAEFLHDEIPREARVLIVGCGNSSLSADMYDDGYRNLVSTDFSEVVIEKMRAKHQAARPELRWEKMDMLALDAEDAGFDAVVDKAAMDALMVDKGDPWNPEPATIESAHRMCAEVSRVLVPGGVFVQLSFEQVHFRRKFLLGEHALFMPAVAESCRGRTGPEQGGEVGGGGGLYGWDMEVHHVQREGGCFGQFLYILRKRGGVSGDCVLERGE
eukprot:g13909.t1